jgi:hypothetical protein
MKLRIIFYILCSLFYLNGNAQSCGTYILSNQLQLESTITITPLSPTQSLPQVNKNLSVAFYIIKDSLDSYGVTPAQIDQAIALLDSAFRPINLQFHVCSINYIENYQFNFLGSSNEAELTGTSQTKDVINIYLATFVFDQFQNSVKGYTHMPASDKNCIFLDKAYITGSELLHQMGHFFNLYHTYETIFGNVKERVTRVDCDVTGDLCCDTEADPNLLGMVSLNCLYTGTSKDQDNVVYSPSVKNIMSNSIDACRCYFTQTQFLRIIYAIRNLKSNLR